MVAISTNIAPKNEKAQPNFFIRVINAINHWNDTRRTFYALSKLSDRELADIGIDRSEIFNVADGTKQRSL